MNFPKNNYDLDDNVKEVLPEGIVKRVRIENPIDPPTSASGAKIYDFDEDGKLIDVYFENTKAYQAKTYNFEFLLVA